MARVFGAREVWRIGTQNRFDGENFNGLSIYIYRFIYIATKGVKVKQKVGG